MNSYQLEKELKCNIQQYIPDLKKNTLTVYLQFEAILMQNLRQVNTTSIQFITADQPAVQF